MMCTGEVGPRVKNWLKLHMLVTVNKKVIATSCLKSCYLQSTQCKSFSFTRFGCYFVLKLFTVPWKGKHKYIKYNLGLYVCVETTRSRRARCDLNIVKNIFFFLNFKKDRNKQTGWWFTCRRISEGNAGAVNCFVTLYEGKTAMRWSRSQF